VETPEEQAITVAVLDLPFHVFQAQQFTASLTTNTTAHKSPLLCL